MIDEPTDLPIHVVLSEPCPHGRGARAAVRGQSVRLQGKFHDFSVLVPIYGSAFTVSLLDTFTRVYVHATGSTTERRSANLRRFLLFIARRSSEPSQENSTVERVLKALRDRKSETINREDMVAVVEEYVGKLRDIRDLSIVSTENELTRQNMIESISTILQDLGREGMWPDIGPLRGFQRRRPRGDIIPSLGELVRTGEVEVPEAKAESYASITELSRVRLLRLRELLEEALLDEEEMFDEQQRLTTMVEKPALSEIMSAVKSIPIDYGKSEFSKLSIEVRRCFPLSGENSDSKRLSSLLRYLQEAYAGLFRLQDLPFGVQRVVAMCGGTGKVMSYLEGGPRALMSAYSLVLIDSGINIQPCDDLAADPFIGKAKHGKVRLRKVGSIKNRAGFKAVEGFLADYEKEPTSPDVHSEPGVVDELPLVVRSSKVSGARAIEIWLKLSEPQRDRARRAGNREANYLWILRHGHAPTEVRRYRPPSWKHWWSEFLKVHVDDPVIGGLPIQRRMIRTTVAQLRAAQHDADAPIAALLAGHSAQITARHYLNRTHIVKLYDQKIREFQNLFEASVAGDSPNRPRQLSLSPEILEERKQTAVETGLGFLCANPLAGIQPGTQDRTCTRLEACSSCPLLRFVPSKDAIEAMVLFHRSLEAAQTEFLARNPARWIRIWLPAIALCAAISELLAASAKRFMLEQAHQTVEAGLSAGSHSMFRPW